MDFNEPEGPSTQVEKCIIEQGVAAVEPTVSVDWEL